MGKCLSCFKPQHVSTICMNETNNTFKNKSDKSNFNVTGNGTDGCKTRSSQHQSFVRCNVSHLNTMSGLYRRDYNKSQDMNVVNEEGTQFNTSVTNEDCNHRNSKSKSKQHFSPFFGSRATSLGKDDENKIKMRSDSQLEFKLHALFDKYKDTEEKDMMLMEGVEKLCSDLNLQPDDFKILILAWKFNAEQMCQFTRPEFVNGCKDMKVENISQMRDRLSELVTTLKRDQQQFKLLYRFTFKFGLDRAVGERILPKDVALCLWKLVFTLHKPPILDKWLAFLRSDEAHVRGVPRDTWNMFLNFCETVGNDLSLYDDAEAWPSIFDDFVEYEKGRSQ